LFAGEINRLAAHLQKIGCTTWLWGDRFLDGKATGIGKWEASENQTQAAIDQVSKDIIICDWHYEKAHTTAEFFARKGFRVVSCPWRKPAVALAQLEQIRAIRKHTDAAVASRALGMVQTTWCGFTPFVKACEAQADGATPAKGSASEAAQCFKSLFQSIRAGR
jgi:hypothetical protein